VALHSAFSADGKALITGLAIIPEITRVLFEARAIPIHGT